MPDCSLCRNPDFEGQRVQWGCNDLKTNEPRHARSVVFKTTCSTCGGAGCKESDEWEWPDVRCVEGHREYFQCPNSVMTATPAGADVRRFLEAYRVFDEHHVLPTEGAFLDQTCHFVEGIRVASSERAAWEAVLRKHQENTSKTPK